MKASNLIELEKAYSAGWTATIPLGVKQEDWEDALQITALEFMVQPPRRISKNLVLMRARSRAIDAQRRQRRVAPLPMNEELYNPSYMASSSEDLNPLVGNHGALSPGLEEALFEWIGREYDNQATATALGISPTAFRKRLQRIRKHVRLA